jgi:preprotein translocase subunit YajC
VQGGVESLLFLGLLIVVFYFLLIRPQKRRVEAHRELVESVEVGDEVVTIGGMYGRVRAIEEDSLLLEVADGTAIRFIKSAIARRVADETEEDEGVVEDGPAISPENGERP